MKRILLFLIILFPCISFAQSVIPLRGDTILIYKQGGSAEFVLRNKTKDSLGFLYNKGNGITEFRRMKQLNDSTLIFGGDTFHVKGGAGGLTDSAYINGINAGSTDSSIYEVTASGGVALFKALRKKGVFINCHALSDSTIACDIDSAALRTWVLTFASGGGGVNAVGTFNATSTAKGSDISGSTITMHQGDATNPGLVKLYTSTGSSTDGTMDRNSINTALATKQATLVNTTNIKSINGTSLLGSGDLAVGGLSDGDKGDVTVSSTGSVFTVDNNVVSNAKIRQSVGISLIGRSANSTGNVADIVATTSKTILGYNGTTIGFIAIDSTYLIGSHSKLYYDSVYVSKVNALPVILNSPANGQILVDSIGFWVNRDNTASVTDSIFELTVGTGAAPADGGSVYTNTYFINKKLNVSVSGLSMINDSTKTLGAGLNATTGRLKFGASLHTGEPIKIQAYGVASSASGPILEELTFTTNSGPLVNTSNVWTGTSTSDYHNNYGLDSKKLATGTDGWIECVYTASDATYGVIAFNTSNTNQRYVDNPTSPTTYYYEAGIVLFASGDLRYLDNNTAPTTSGYTLSTGDWIRIKRTGSVLTLETSPDHSTWTNRHTYTFSSTADLFINMNIDRLIGVSKVYHPKGYNVQ